MVVMRDGRCRGSRPRPSKVRSRRLPEIRLDGGDERNGDALPQPADHRRLPTIGVDHVVARVIAAENLIAAVGGGQQVLGPNADAIQAGLDRQPGEAPEILLAGEPLFLNRRRSSRIRRRCMRWRYGWHAVQECKVASFKSPKAKLTRPRSCCRTSEHERRIRRTNKRKSATARRQKQHPRKPGVLGRVAQCVAQGCTANPRDATGSRTAQHLLGLGRQDHAIPDGQPQSHRKPGIVEDGTGEHSANDPQHHHHSQQPLGSV